MPPRVNRIGARWVGMVVTALGLEFVPHAQRHQPSVNRRPGSTQRLLPDDELVDVCALNIHRGALPPCEEDTDVADVMNNGGGPWESATQIRCERGDGIGHTC